MEPKGARGICLCRDSGEGSIRHIVFPRRPHGSPMLGRLILLFLATPAVELALLIQVDRLIGFWATVGVIIATGLVGSHLARREGLSTWRRLNDRLRRGDLPGTELADGVIILVSGALLITPGILTDILGFLGLLPLTRARLRKWVMRWFQRKMEQGTMQVQFGVFGGSGPRGPSAPSPPSSEPQGSSSNAAWQEQSHKIPDHTEPSPEDPTPPDSAANTSS